MAKPKNDVEAMHEIAFEAFGVRVSIAAPAESQIEAAKAMLPPGWRPCSPDDVDKRFTIEPDALTRWVLHRDGRPVTGAGLGPQHVLMLLESQMRSFIALNAPGLIFVHAGVVAVGDRLLVMPGFSFSGKTTLVAAMVRAGATYYSDEYAPVDENGRVHPYPRNLSFRGRSRARSDAHVGELGGAAGEQPLPIERIVVTSYKPGSEWQPRRLTGGESMLALLSHAVPAQSRPEQSMKHLTRAVNGAVGLESPRGESEELVPVLLEELRG